MAGAWPVAGPRAVRTGAPLASCGHSQSARPKQPQLPSRSSTASLPLDVLMDRIHRVTSLRWTALLLFGHLAATSSVASAQADSLAAVARADYRDALVAWRGGDIASARQKLVHAATVWPAQAAYLHAAASASARLGDTAAAALWLNRLADLGQWREVKGDEDFLPVLGAPAVETAISRLEANRLPMVRSRVAFTLPDSSFFPEGIDVDPVGHEWFIGSIRHGRLVRVNGAGLVRPFADGVSLDAVFGVRVDAQRRRLWVTTRATPLQADFQAGSPARSSVLLFSLDDEALLSRVLLPDDGSPHTLGDLALAQDGSAYITDSEQPVVFRANYVPETGIHVAPFLEHRLFRSLQGAAFSEDGQTLFVADYSHGIVAVDLASRSVREVPASPGTSSLGIDGLVSWRGSLIGVQNGSVPARVVRLVLSDAGAHIERLEVLDRHLPLADEPTIATILDDRLYYIANSQWPQYEEDGRLRDGAHLVPAAILELPLSP